MKVAEIFSSLQGEGRYAGYPMLFIRTSGCSRSCNWCDTKQHINGKDVSVQKILKTIRESKIKRICFTGGEPLLQIEDILQVVFYVYGEYSCHLETNGDLLSDNTEDISQVFDYISISPKERSVAEQCKKVLKKFCDEDAYDIKVVTDLKTVGINMLKYATILMPFTFGNVAKDLLIRQSVWQYCVDNNLRYSPRLHYEIFGKKRGV